MGSTEGAVVTGFICRLCAKVNRFVIHIFGEEGERLQLVEKIKAYLPITVAADDPLPKTVCMSCIYRLEVYHELVQHYRWAQRRLKELIDAEKEGKKEEKEEGAQEKDSNAAGPSHLSQPYEDEGEVNMECEEEEEELDEEVEEEEEEVLEEAEEEEEEEEEAVEQNTSASIVNCDTH